MARRAKCDGLVGRESLGESERGRSGKRDPPGAGTALNPDAALFFACDVVLVDCIIDRVPTGPKKRKEKRNGRPPIAALRVGESRY